MSGGPIPYVTPTNQPFWDGTAVGELRVRTCVTCGHLFRFVSDWCPNCWSTDLSWIRSRGQGRIIARTVVHVAPYESVAARVPYVIALVALDEGPTMMSNIVDCSPAEAKIGLAVELTFEDRAGLKLPQFRPARRQGSEKL